MTSLPNMKCLCPVVLALLVFSCGGCCKSLQSSATRPAKVRGWETWDDRGLHLIGEFVLKKGEKSDNGNIGIELLDVKEGKATCLFFEEPTEPEAILRFYSLSDPQISCTVTTHVAGRILDCDKRLNLNTLGVFAINAREGWVHFNLG